MNYEQPQDTEMPENEGFDINSYLGTIEMDYNKHREEKTEEETTQYNDSTNIDNPINRIPKDDFEKSKFGSFIDRDLELWGHSQYTHKELDRQGFQSSSKKDTTINNRLNSRNDYPRVLPFTRELNKTFDMRPQFSRDFKNEEMSDMNRSPLDNLGEDGLSSTLFSPYSRNNNS